MESGHEDLLGATASGDGHSYWLRFKHKVLESFESNALQFSELRLGGCQCLSCYWHRRPYRNRAVLRQKAKQRPSRDMAGLMS